MSLRLFRLNILSHAVLLFSFWIFSIHANWSFFQNTRSIDPLWLVHNVYPWLYIIIFFYVLLFAIIFWNNFENKLFNIIFLGIFCVIIYVAPYIMSEYYRFPDTFSVVKNSLLIQDIISKNMHVMYPQSYPSSYVFFNLVHTVTNIDLFLFSRLIWSPLILIGTITLWYIFVEKFFNNKVALVTCMLAIPSQIIEITCSPNSLGIFLVLISLLLCTYKNNNFNFLLLVTLLTCLLTHSISFIILLLFFSVFYLFNFSQNSIIKISFNILILAIVLWFFWTLLTAGMGEGIVRAIYKILTLESKSTEHLFTYTFSSGNLVYPWIQKYNNYKYELYALLTFFVFTADAHEVYKTKINVFNNNLYSKRLMFLTSSFILLFITLLNLTYGGSDTENIISRTLNFSMLTISAYIGSYFFNFSCFPSKFSHKKRNVLLILFLLVVSTTYPSYSYARESYISYPLSQKYGDNFFLEHEDESNMDKYSKSTEFYNIMRKQSSVESVNTEGNFIIYKNGWCSFSILRGSYNE